MTTVTLPTTVTQSELNFVVTGNLRSGAGWVQNVLSGLPRLVCHPRLLHPDEQQRRQFHEIYFGESLPKEPSWFRAASPDGLVNANPWQYLVSAVFDHAARGEDRVGLHLPYVDLDEYQLYDLLESRIQEGDFAVVHVERNPLACLVSLKEAEYTKVWRRAPGSSVSRPRAVRLDPTEATEFVRRSKAISGKIQRYCQDLLTVSYADLVKDDPSVFRTIMEFLDVPTAHVPSATQQKINTPVPLAQRIAALSDFLRRVPTEVARLVDEDE